MEPILILGISIIVLSPSITSLEPNSLTNPWLQSCPYCIPCASYARFKTEPVKVFKPVYKKDTIFCVSLFPIEWEFVWGSGGNIRHEPPTGYEVKKLIEFEFSHHQFFCTGLTVHPQPQAPNGTAGLVLGRCKGNNVSSELYDIGKVFKPQIPTYKSRASSGHKGSSTESSNLTYAVSQNKGPNPGKQHDAGPRPGKQHDEGPNPGKQHDEGPKREHSPTSNIITFAVIGGATVCVILLLILVVVLMRKVKEQRRTIEMTSEEIDEFMRGVPLEKANARGINEVFVLPYDTRLEVPKAKVTFCSTILGAGAFGLVMKGAYKGNSVAIKMLKNNSNGNAEYLRSLLGELKVMSYLGNHHNLVALVGAITENIKDGEVYLIFEYCSNGNAQKFVRSHKDKFLDMWAGPVSSTLLSRRSATSFATKDLVRWAYEVASGMEYVSAQHVYHGDLAARNILLTEDLTAKVGDFGLSKQLDMEKYSCYVKKTKCPLPVKWMAIESLRNLTFSIQSDVWSYGVTLWEFFTLGATPYPGVDWNFDSWKLLCDGKRLDRPQYASDSLYDIMMSC